MTTLTLEKQITKKHKKIGGHLYRILMEHLPPQPIRDRGMFDAYSNVLDSLGRLLTKDTSPDRNGIEIYFGAVSHFVSEYEKEEFSLESPTAEEMLRFFMEQHDLTQTDLADDLGGQPVVSDILNGKPRLTRDQIERLTIRFHVTPWTFFRMA